MEYTELSAYDVAPGVVTTWTPAADAAAWSDDDRGLSPNHELHLAESEVGSWIGSIMRIPAPLDADVLSRALRAWMARHEVLRAGVVPTDAGWRRRTVPADAVRLETADLGRRSGEEAQQAIADFLAASVSPYAWPHCVFATVDDPAHPEAGFTLAFGADHSVMDAYSQLLWFEEIVGLYERAAAGVPDGELAMLEVGSNLDHADVERAFAEALTADAEPVVRWRDYLTAEDRPGFPAFPVADVANPVDRTPEGRADAPRLKQASFATWLTDAPTAGILNQLCRAGGMSLQSGVLAGMVHAFREVHGVERVRFVLPMHTRFTPEFAAAIGWYVGLCPVDVDITGVRTLPEVAVRVHEAVAAGKELVAHPFARVRELLGVRDTPHFAVSYVDARFVPGADRWDEWDARALRSPAFADDEVYLWFGRTADGLNVSARYPETITAERAMRDLVAGVAEVLEETARPLLRGESLVTTA